MRSHYNRFITYKNEGLFSCWTKKTLYLTIRNFQEIWRKLRERNVVLLLGFLFHYCAFFFMQRPLFIFQFQVRVMIFIFRNILMIFISHLLQFCSFQWHVMKDDSSRLISRKLIYPNSTKNSQFVYSNNFQQSSYERIRRSDKIKVTIYALHTDQSIFMLGHSQRGCIWCNCTLKINYRKI
jgi:hypothetical protein